MSDSDSDDYGELDFVSAASTNLKSVLRKPISTSSISPSLEIEAEDLESNCDSPSLDDSSFMDNSTTLSLDDSVYVSADDSLKRKTDESPAPTKRRGRRSAAALDKENLQTSPIPPPPAPTPGPKPRAVRGAKRTKKTEQALKMIENKNAKARLPECFKKKQNGKNVGELSISIGAEEQIEIVEDSFEIKVKWKTNVMRIEVQDEERLGAVMDRFAAEVGLSAGDIGFLNRDQDDGGDESHESWIPRETTVSNLGLSVVSFLVARARDSGNQADLIELKVQTKDRRESVNIKVKKTDKMQVLMNKFAELKKIPLENLRFFFDGEELEASETAETLDLEGGECIDVHST
ncbi:uncharacterized protein CG4449 [Eurytemora carolleeae]|uniref:uncharacterized protein CG4449 n=1 Tax=Eurytemora carolleeae TaxID=1294199 RepID=UPI000C784D9B|nr:uncharacterized protein CG4449 [Eurytemora carolleeae]|eukprot:XP_023345883.1 uncharacterized protein CG4449-like [Eurytemora affinis]